MIPLDLTGTSPPCRSYNGNGVYLLYGRTLFGYACDPGDLLEDGSLLEAFASNIRLKETFHEFNRVGEDFADLIHDRTLSHLIIIEWQENRDL